MKDKKRYLKDRGKQRYKVKETERKRAKKKDEFKKTDRKKKN